MPKPLRAFATLRTDAGEGIVREMFDDGHGYLGLGEIDEYAASLLRHGYSVTFGDEPPIPLPLAPPVPLNSDGTTNRMEIDRSCSVLLDGIEISTDLLRQAFTEAPPKEEAQWAMVRSWRDGERIRFERCYHPDEMIKLALAMKGNDGA